MGEVTTNLEKKLADTGFSRDVVRAAWPTWWSTSAEKSPSALNDLKFSVARKLGISPSSLFDEGDATFVWKGQAKFKGLTARDEKEQQVLASFGQSIAKLLLLCRKDDGYSSLEGVDPFLLHAAILGTGRPSVAIPDLMALSYSMGIPVIYARVFPLKAKRMTAMTVRAGRGYAIILARDSMYPAPVAFYLAHELGHIARQHLKDESAIIDLDLGKETSRDLEEQEADSFALSLLTGRQKVELEQSRQPRNSTELADSIQRASYLEQIDPGTLAMCYGYRHNKWALANSALRVIYGIGSPAWEQVNRLAANQLDFSRLSPDYREFMSKILGVAIDV